MHSENWNMGWRILPLAMLLLAGCEPRDVDGPLPVRVAQTAEVPSAQPIPVPSPAGSNSASPAASAGAGFSLPIGGEIPAPPATAASAPNVVPSGSGDRGATDSPPPMQPQSPPSPPRGNPSSAGAPAATERKLVKLSAGVALPQSLPDGTAIGVSVDYSVDGELHRSSRYYCVIKSGAADVVTEVQLESSGTLAAFFSQLKPEHRPFSARIEEIPAGSKRRIIISNELSLKTDY
jgi:hypothetical protein